MRAVVAAARASLARHRSGRPARHALSLSRCFPLSRSSLFFLSECVSKMYTQGGGIRRRRSSLPSAGSREVRLRLYEQQQQRRREQQKQLLLKQQQEQQFIRRSVPPPLPLIQADRRKTPPLAAKAISANGKEIAHIEHRIAGVRIHDGAGDDESTALDVADDPRSTSAASVRFPVQAPEQCWDLKRSFTDRCLLQQASGSFKQVC